ncbi:MFS transporter [Paenibacillus piri]|nr:MFS transporter [Paenibacillus piri]
MVSFQQSALSPARQAAQTEDRTRSLMLLAVMLFTVFLSVANIFIVNVATPSIQRGLHASFSEVQLVITSYTLAYAVTLIIGGRLGDRFGRKRMLFVGVAGFTAASFLCGIASGVTMLIVMRIIQGLSAALMAPQVLSLIQANYAPERRAAVFGMYGAAQGIAATSGQLIGGLLLRWNPLALDWRTVFFFSVPIGIVIIGLIPFIAESRGESQAKLDWIGAAGAAAGLLMLIYPLVQGQKEGWPLGLIVCLVLSFPVLAAFVWYERRLTRKGESPFMNVDLFRQRSFTYGMVIVFLLFCSQSAYFLVSAYFLQIGLGYTALKAGLIILPMGTGYFLASLYSAKAVAKFGLHVLTCGAVMTSLGYVYFAWSLHSTGLTAFGFEWIPALFVLGFGQGAIAAPLTHVILAQIRSSDIGSASGILTTGMQVAFAIGIALIGLLFLNTLGSHADTVGRQFAPQLQQAIADFNPTGGQGEAVLRQFQSCYAEYARSTNPTVLPTGCSTDNSNVRGVLTDVLKQANARNYAESFVFCLYVLAVFTAGLTPLVLGLIRRKQTGSV